MANLRAAKAVAVQSNAIEQHAQRPEISSASLHM